MRKFFIDMWTDESGAAAAEYALILSVVAVGIALGAGLLGGAIDGAIRTACGEVNGTPGVPC
jgi:pilus assembly protein Flp/PilA